MYILNRDAAARLTISSPLEAHKANTLVYHVVGVDVGFENPMFACLEMDYEVSMQRLKPRHMPFFFSFFFLPLRFYIVFLPVKWWVYSCLFSDISMWRLYTPLITACTLNYSLIKTLFFSCFKIDMVLFDRKLILTPQGRRQQIHSRLWLSMS